MSQRMCARTRKEEREGDEKLRYDMMLSRGLLLRNCVYTCVFIHTRIYIYVLSLCERELTHTSPNAHVVLLLLLR